MSLNAKILFVAMLVGLAHIVSGIAVFIAPSALTVTPLASLHHFALSMGYTGGFVGTTLIAAGAMALIGANLNIALPRTVHTLLFAPQQTLLLLQIYTISMALIEGHYPDGYTPAGGAWFILADQIWAWILAVSHSLWLAGFLYGDRPNGDSRPS